jgi:hypothetical protein
LAVSVAGISAKPAGFYSLEEYGAPGLDEVMFKITAAR